MRDGEHAMYR